VALKLFQITLFSYYSPRDWKELKRITRKSEIESARILMCKCTCISWDQICKQTGGNGGFSSLLQGNSRERYANALACSSRRGKWQTFACPRKCISAEAARVVYTESFKDVVLYLQDEKPVALFRQRAPTSSTWTRCLASFFFSTVRQFPLCSLQTRVRLSVPCGLM
jgi:hypothetical protein